MAKVEVALPMYGAPFVSKLILEIDCHSRELITLREYHNLSRRGGL